MDSKRAKGPETKGEDKCQPPTGSRVQELPEGMGVREPSPVPVRMIWKRKQAQGVSPWQGTQKRER